MRKLTVLFLSVLVLTSCTKPGLNLPADSPMPRYTYSPIGLFKAALFSAPWCALAPGNPTGQAAPLAPLLRRAMDAGRVGASLYTGRWTDVGTPQRWAELQQ